jgi:SH3-like domain-containing protein
MLSLAVLLGTGWWSAKAHAQGGSPPSSPAQGSGLPVPRYVSLKSDRVRVRQGPGLDHKVLWVFRRAGLPVEVIAEFEGWRQIRDAEGTTGWVVQSLVSGRRTALVLPWEAKSATTPASVALRRDDRESAKSVAVVEPGVLADIRSCDGQWCYVSIGAYRGYIEQKKLWGVYEGEIVR